MVCCPPEMVTEPDLSTQPGPRFPDPRGEARAVEDRQANLCSRWRDNGGCRLDTHHQISKVDLANGLVYSWHLFELMSSVCIDTCGWTGDKVASVQLHSVSCHLSQSLSYCRVVWMSMPGVQSGQQLVSAIVRMDNIPGLMNMLTP